VGRVPDSWHGGEEKMLVRLTWKQEKELMINKVVEDIVAFNEALDTKIEAYTVLADVARWEYISYATRICRFCHTVLDVNEADVECEWTDDWCMEDDA
jgi:hypothetical protein